MKLLFSFVVLSCIAIDAAAFRCGTSLVNENDTQTDVLKACGNPAIKYRQGVPFVLEVGDIHRRRRVVTVEYWVYLPGINEFARILTFENGTLKQITRGDYSSRYKTDPENCRRENSHVENGQTAAEIELRCGKPDFIEEIEEYSQAVGYDGNNRLFKQILVEQWWYQKNDTVRIYRFENGILRRQLEDDTD